MCVRSDEIGNTMKQHILDDIMETQSHCTLIGRQYYLRICISVDNLDMIWIQIAHSLCMMYHGMLSTCLCYTAVHISSPRDRVLRDLGCALT